MAQSGRQQLLHVVMELLQTVLCHNLHTGMHQPGATMLSGGTRMKATENLHGCSDNGPCGLAAGSQPAPAASPEPAVPQGLVVASLLVGAASPAGGGAEAFRDSALAMTSAARICASGATAERGSADRHFRYQSAASM